MRSVQETSVSSTVSMLTACSRERAGRDRPDATTATPRCRSASRVAVEHLNGLGMDADGWRQAADVCHWLLTARLEFFEDRKRYPVADEVIERPMFVTGEPRSGTTLMHALMSVDPDARALRFWEVMYPSPPPGLAGADDPRRARADADWREINAQDAEVAAQPSLQRHARRRPARGRTHLGVRLPGDDADRVVAGADADGGRGPADRRARRSTASTRRCCSSSSTARPPKRWVLKGFHGFRLAEFFDAYPDATLVWLHRDPVQVAASRTMMMADILEGIVGPDRPAGRGEDASGADSRQASRNTMTNPLVDDPRIHARPLPRLRRRPGGHGRAATTTFCGRTLTAGGRDGDARLSGEQPG